MELRSAARRRRREAAEASSSREEASETVSGATAPPGPAPAAAQVVEYEFGGPIGASLTMVCLPVLVVVLSVSCDGAFCLGIDPVSTARWPGELVSPRALAIVAGWIGFQAILQIALPGPTALGAPIRDTGTRLAYKLNGHLAFWVSVAAMGHGWPRADGSLGPAPLSRLYDLFPQLAVAACALSLALGLALYAASFRRPQPILAIPGSTGCAVYDLFMGRELNPRLPLGLDLKCFCELRPGLIGWLVLNLACCAKRRELRGAVGAPLALVTLFQGIYVWDSLYYEKAILTTMDITTDGFGVMLAFGDLAWVPFTYSLQARFLVSRDPDLPAAALVAIAALQSIGYLVFRGANSQKDLFRSDFDAAKAQGMRWIETASGRKLLVSGFWGAARKINYTGDWLMSLAWCLLTGFKSPVPYFYCVYFAVLLAHRASRDDHACARKYGPDWPRYKAHVPYIFVPGLF